MIRHFFSKQFLIYLLMGGTATTVNFGARILFNLWFSFSTSILLSHFAGMAIAFSLTKVFLFCLVNLITIIQTWLISMGFAYYLLPAFHITALIHEISHAAGIGLSVFTSYLGHKYWSFR